MPNAVRSYPVEGAYAAIMPTHTMISIESKLDQLISETRPNVAAANQTQAPVPLAPTG